MMGMVGGQEMCTNFYCTFLEMDSIYLGFMIQAKKAKWVCSHKWEKASQKIKKVIRVLF